MYIQRACFHGVKANPTGRVPMVQVLMFININVYG